MHPAEYKSVIYYCIVRDLFEHPWEIKFCWRVCNYNEVSGHWIVGNIEELDYLDNLSSEKVILDFTKVESIFSKLEELTYDGFSEKPPNFFFKPVGGNCPVEL